MLTQNLSSKFCRCTSRDLRKWVKQQHLGGCCNIIQWAGRPVRWGMLQSGTLGAPGRLGPSDPTFPVLTVLGLTRTRTHTRACPEVRGSTDCCNPGVNSAGPLRGYWWLHCPNTVLLWRYHRINRRSFARYQHSVFIDFTPYALFTKPNKIQTKVNYSRTVSVAKNYLFFFLTQNSLKNILELSLVRFLRLYNFCLSVNSLKCKNLNKYVVMTRKKSLSILKDTL